MKYTFKKTPEEIFIHSISNIVTEVNKGFMKFTGYSEEDLIGKSLTEISTLLRIDSQVYLENIESKHNCYMFTKKYEAREVTISCRSLESRNDNIYYFKEQINSRIEDKFMYLEQLFKDNMGGTAIYSFPDLILLKANEKHLDKYYLHDKKENILGKKFKEIVTQYKWKDVERNILNIIETGKSYHMKELEYEHPEKGITYWNIELTPIYLKEKIKYLIQTSSDVTERVINRNLIEKQAKVIAMQNTDRVKSDKNLLLKTQYDLLNTTIENLGLNYTLISYPDSKIKYMNSSAYNYLRKINNDVKSLSSCIGNDAYAIFNFTADEETAISSKLQYLIKNKVTRYFFHRRVFIAGKETFIKVMYQPLFNENNEVTEVVTIGMDITEEIKAKNKIEETLKIQDEIFANISHELKTPLSVIFTTNQLLELYLKADLLEPDKEKLCKCINIIKQNCYRFTKLINNIVDISKIDSGFFKLNLSNENIVSVAENIVQSVSSYIKEKGINVIFDTNTEEKIIACDPEKIDRVILNLISNSIKFTNPGGLIFVNLIDKGDTVELSVKDTGIGIDEKHLNKIFERFHQVDKSLSRNTEGSGIGLSIVKSIVELHDGKISVESSPGEGSVFRIELPAKTMEDVKITEKINPIDNKIEMIKVEFSDIYSM
ncbi:MAG: ATP-binding protein [Clostridiaceae bacterium]